MHICLLNKTLILDACKNNNLLTRVAMLGDVHICLSIMLFLLLIIIMPKPCIMHNAWCFYFSNNSRSKQDCCTPGFLNFLAKNVFSRRQQVNKAERGRCTQTVDERLKQGGAKLIKINHDTRSTTSFMHI